MGISHLDIFTGGVGGNALFGVCGVGALDSAGQFTGTKGSAEFGKLDSELDGYCGPVGENAGVLGKRLSRLLGGEFLGVVDGNCGGCGSGI